VVIRDADIKNMKNPMNELFYVLSVSFWWGRIRDHRMTRVCLVWFVWKVLVLEIKE
jgi:hypothetical protein